MKVVVVERSAHFYGSAKNLLRMIKYGVEEHRFDIVLAESGLLCERLDELGYFYKTFQLPNSINVYDKVIVNRSLIGKLHSVYRLIRWWFTRGLISEISSGDLLIVNNTRSFYFFLFPILCAKLSRRKIVWRIQVDSPLSYLSKNIFFRISNLIVVHGGVTTLTRIFPNFKETNLVKVFEYTNGIDLSELPPISVLEVKSRRRKRLVAVSLIERRKAIHDLIKVMEILPEDIELHHYGAVKPGSREGEIYERELKSMVQSLRLEGRVIFHGYVCDVANKLKEYDLFVLASYNETQPYVISEAMASSLPVVATDVGGVPHQVIHEKNGYIVQPGDIFDFAACIRLALSEVNYMKLCVESRKHVESNFNEQLTEVCLLKKLQGL